MKYSTKSSEEFCDQENCSECDREKERRAAWLVSKNKQSAQSNTKQPKQPKQQRPTKALITTHKLGQAPKQANIISTIVKPFTTPEPPVISATFAPKQIKSVVAETTLVLNPTQTPVPNRTVSGIITTAPQPLGEGADLQNKTIKSTNQSIVVVRSAASPAITYTTMDTIKSLPSGYRFALSLFLAEFIGTFMLVAIGDGSIASYVLTKQQVNTFVACLGFGVGAMVAMFASAKISGGHHNPAASVAFAITGDLKWKYVPVYIIAQYLGGFMASLMLLINYSEAINFLDNGQRQSSGTPNATGWIFATYPAPYVTPWGALLDQIIGTSVLLFGLSAVTDKNNMNLETRHQPLCIALVIGMTCLAFSPNCGAIFNPARDLAPRLMTYLFGWGTSVWTPIGGTYWFLAGVLGPHIGAILGVYAYRFFIGNTLERRDEYEPPEQHQISETNTANKDLTEDAKYGSTLRSI